MKITLGIAVCAFALNFIIGAPDEYLKIMTDRAAKAREQPAQLCAFQKAVTIYGDFYPAKARGEAWLVPCRHVVWYADA